MCDFHGKSRFRHHLLPLIYITYELEESSVLLISTPGVLGGRKESLKEESAPIVAESMVLHPLHPFEIGRSNHVRHFAGSRSTCMRVCCVIHRVRPIL